MKLDRLFLITLGILLFSIGSVSAAYYVDDPNSCPTTYVSQNCLGGERMCGYSASTVYCYDMTLLSAPGSTATSNTNYANADGGYVVDCEGFDGSAPHCDNGGNFLCDRNSGCYSNNRDTICAANKFAADVGAYTCGDCRSGYLDCDGSGTSVPSDGVCEVRIGVTSYSSNSVYNATCGAVCASGYLDINGDGTGSDGDGCEIQIGGSCSVGALSGTYDSGGNCVVSKSYFETGTETSYSSNDPLLWGNQYGSGQLLNLTNKGTNASFAINNSGCIVFPDGSTQCEAGSGSGSGNITGSGASGRVTFWTGTSQISSSGNFFWDNTFGRLGIGTSSPTSKLSINGTVGNGSEGIGFGDGDTTIYESSENQLTFNFSTIGNWIMDGTYFRSGSTGPRLRGTTANETVPTLIPAGADNDTGIGWIQDNVLGLIAGGINVMSLANTSYVGIGTTNPVNALDVVGNINATGNVTGENIIINNQVEIGENLNVSHNVTVGGDVCLDDGTCLSNASAATTLGGYDASFFMPLNTSVNGDFDFNGGWASEGLSIVGGSIYAQTGYFYNISSLQVTNLEVNGSLTPYQDFDDTFDLGSSISRWRNLYLSQNANINGTVYADYFSGDGSNLTGISGTQISNDFNYWNETYYGGIGNWTADRDNYYNSTYIDENYALNGSLGNYVPYTGASQSLDLGDNNLTIGTSDFFVNNENGRVGIGNTTPRGNLDIYGDNAEVHVGTSQKGYIGVGTQGDYSSAFSNDAAIVLNTVGLKGTGTSSLQVRNFLDNDYGEVRALRFTASTSGSESELAYENSGETAGIFFPGATDLGFSTNDTERLRIDESGNVGIGTDSPDAKFQVYDGNNNFKFNQGLGGITPYYGVSGTGVKAVALLTGTSGSSVTFDDAGFFAISKDSNANLVAGNSSGGTSLLRVDSNGNVGIGTSNPQNKLNVNGDGNFTGNVTTQADFCIEGGNCLSSVISSGGGWTDTGSQIQLIDNTRHLNATGFFLNNTSGRLGIGTTDPSVSLEINSSSTSGALRIRGDSGVDEIADIYVQAAGNLVLDTTAGTDATGYIEVRPEDNEWGFLVRESDGTGYDYANFYLKDDPTDDYLSINLKTFNQADALFITASDRVGIGTPTPQNKLNVVGDANFTGNVTTQTDFCIEGGDCLSSVGGGGGGWTDNGTLVSLTAPMDDLNATSLFVNNTLGRVGIGTSSPQNTLEVVSSSDATLKLYNPNTANGGAVLKLQKSKTGYAREWWAGVGIQGANTDSFSIYDFTGTATRFLIESSGQTGINTTTPNATLHVVGNATFTGNVTTQTDFCIEGGDCLSSVGLASGNVQGSGSSMWVPLWNGTSSLNRSNIYQGGSGNIGIGTTSPTSKLHVVQGSTFGIVSSVSSPDTSSPGSSFGLQVINSHPTDGNYASVWFGDTVGSATSVIASKMTNRSSNYGQLNFYTRGTNSGFSEKMTILEDGNVGINTTTPTNLLNVVGDANFTGNVTTQTDFCIEGGDCLSSVSASSLGAIEGSGTFGYLARFNGTTSLNNSAIYQNGSNIGIGTTTPISLLSIEGSDNTLFRLASTDNRANFIVVDDDTTGVFGVEDGMLYLGGSGTLSSSGLALDVSSGNIGIGTTTPVQKLDVNGSVNVAEDSGYYYGGTQAFRLSNGTDSYYATTIVGQNAGNSSSGKQTVLGYFAGRENTGVGQVATGFQAGYQNTGIYQLASGFYAGYQNTGDRQVALGYQAGRGNSQEYQVAIGDNAGYINSGGYQTAIGNFAGYQNTGFGQVVLGYNAGYQNDAYAQVAIGHQAGYNNSGGYQTAIGFLAGYQNSGDQSIGIGQESIRNNVGDNVVAIGYHAGRYNNDSDKFILQQANVNSVPLISGNFSSGSVNITGNVTTQTDFCIEGGDCLSSVSASSLGAIEGSGTFGYLARFNGTTSLNNSAIYQNGSNIGIGTTTPVQKLDVNGSVNVAEDSGYYYGGTQAFRLSNGTDSYYATTIVGQNAGNSSSERQTAVGYQAGSQNKGISQVAIGYNAGYQNTGSAQTAVGFSAGQENNGSHQSVFGGQAGYQNTANYQAAFGFRAGYENTQEYHAAFGYNAGYQNDGLRSTGIGTFAGYQNTGDYQTALGYDTGTQNTGEHQTALGYRAGYINTGEYQVAVGSSAGYNNTVSEQTAVGYASGYQNTGGSQTAVGYEAGYSNNQAHQTAIGYRAGYQNTGSQNTAIGHQAGYQNSGAFLTSVGFRAGYQNNQAYNTFMGYTSGYQNTGSVVSSYGFESGYQNSGGGLVSMGYRSGYNNSGERITAVGYQAASGNSGSNVVAIGYGAGLGNTQNNRLIIHHAIASNTSLIEGDFSNKKLGVNIEDLVSTFTVNGTGNFTGNVTTQADFCIEGGNCLSSAGVGAGNISGSGTLGYLARFASNTSIVDSAIFESSGNIGIGTTDPQNTLHVYDSSEDVVALFKSGLTSRGGIELRDNDTNPDNVLLYADGNELELWAGGSEKVKIESAGNVGIGATNPTNLLSLRRDSSDGQAFIRLEDTQTNGTNTYIANGAVSPEIFSIYHSGGYAFSISGERNVGINTTNPTSTLHVVGNGNFTQDIEVNEITIGRGKNGITTNTVVGKSALGSVTTGFSNSAFGNNALESLTTGYQNTAFGANALEDNLAGNANTAVGYGALNDNSGTQNTAVGANAIERDSSGSYNVGIGREAMRFAEGGIANVAVGSIALYNVQGDDNTGVGRRALVLLTTGDNNVALGAWAGANITTGSGNIAIGRTADFFNGTLDNQLNIGNVIYGNLTSNQIGINTTTPVGNFNVIGSGNFTGNVTTQADFCIEGGTCLSTVTGTAGGWSDTGTQIQLVDPSRGVNASSLYVNNTNERVYVGGSSGSLGKFTILTSSGDTNGFAMDGMGGQSFRIYGDGSNIQIGRGGATTITIDNSNNVLFNNRNISFDDYTLFVDEPSSRVGIGTNNPTQKLHVNGSILANGFINATGDVCLDGGLCLSQVNSSAGGWTDTGSQIVLTNTSRDVRLSDYFLFDESSERIVVGDHLTQSNFYDNAAKIVTSDSGNAAIGLNTQGTGFSTSLMFFYQKQLVSSIRSNSDGDFRFRVNEDNSVVRALYINGTDGRVGVRTESPVGNFNVNGTGNFTGNVTTQTDFCIEGGTCLSTVTGTAGGWSDTGTQIKLINDTKHVNATGFFLNNTNGRFGIGTSSPDYLLDVAGDGFIENDLYVGSSTGSAVKAIEAHDNNEIKLKPMRLDTGTFATRGNSYPTTFGNGPFIFSLNSNNLANPMIVEWGTTPFNDFSTLLSIRGDTTNDRGSTVLELKSEIDDYTSGAGGEYKLFYSNISVVNLSSDVDYFHTKHLINENIAYVMDFDGRVGIGNHTPEAKLHVFQNASSSTSAVFDSADSQNSLIKIRNINQNTADGVQIGVRIDDLTLDNRQQNGAIVFRTKNSTGGEDERVRINSEGYLGIGTTSPTQKAHVEGNLNVTGIIYGDGSGISGLVASSSSWNRSGTDVFLANTADNVGIGTTNPGYPLEVVGSTGVTPVQIGAYGSGSQNIQSALQLERKNSNSPSNGISLEFLGQGGAYFGNIYGTYTESGSAGVGAVGLQTSDFGTLKTRFLIDDKGSVGLGGSLQNHTSFENSILFINGSTGLVGINNTSPNNALDVVGDINATGNVTATYFIGDGSQLTGIAAGSGSGAWTNTSGVIYPENLSHEVAIGTNNSQGFRLNVNGDINVVDGSGYYYGGQLAFRLANGTGATYSNTQVGYNAGNSSSDNQTTMGYYAGYEGSASDQTLIGSYAGYRSQSEKHTSLGHYSGYQAEGVRQTSIGSYAGYVSTGSHLTALGYNAGYGNEGNSVTALGSQAGYQNDGNRVTVVGYQAGQLNTQAYQVALGYVAGVSNTGAYQVALGAEAGQSNTGDYQVVGGYQAGQSNTGSFQTALGYYAGRTNKGDRVTSLGAYSGQNNSADDVVAIGYEAGKDNTLADQFILQQANVNPVPLIQGNFSSGFLGIGTNNPSQKLHVNGSLNVTGIIYGDGSGITGLTASSTSWNRSATDVYLANTGDNVGVGTVNPVGKLNVVGDGNFTGNVTATYFIGDGSQLTGIAAGSGSGAWTNTSGVIYPENLSHEVAIGTNNSQGFRLNVNGDINVVDGSGYYYGGQLAFRLANGTGATYSNTQVGFSAGNVSSDSQTALGYFAGYQNTGIHQATFGYYAGYQNTGSQQVSMGSLAGYQNSGDSQTSVGYYAGYQNTAEDQTAIGYQAGYGNSDNSQTAIGVQAGFQNSGFQQVAIGEQAGYQNNQDRQTAIGYQAGSTNTGTYQTVVGGEAGDGNSGDNQVAVGFYAGHSNTGGQQIAIGYQAGWNNSGNNVIAIGHQAGRHNTEHNKFILGQLDLNPMPLISGNFLNGTVGINTTNPVNALNVIGTVNATTFVGDGSQLTGIVASSTSWNRSATDVYLANTGDNVGVGTVNPVGKLNVVGDGNFTGNVTATYFIGDGSQLTGIAAGSGSGAWTNTSGVIYPENLSHEVAIGTNNSQGFRLNVNGDINVVDGSGYYYGGQLAFRLANGTGATYSNTQVGYNAGNSSSRRQTSIGYQSGYQNRGEDQVALGYQSGYNNTGNKLTSIGYQSGYNNTGNFGIGLGYQALFSNSGNNTVAIGYQAGEGNSVSNQFIVHQKNLNAFPLIQGNFANGYVGIGTSSAGYKLEVNGSINVVEGSSYNYGGARALRLSNGTNLNFTNTYVGNNAGNDTSEKQTAIGYLSGSRSTGALTTSVGYEAGYLNNQDRQTAVGYQAGHTNQGGDGQTVFGYQAGYLNEGGGQTALGYQAGTQNTRGFQTAVGHQSGFQNTGFVQTVAGYRAGFQNSGDYNIGLGYYAGYNNTADNVIAIGYEAGGNNTERDQFIVHQRNINSNPLIQGNFSSGFLGIGTNSPRNALNVIGDINATGTIYGDGSGLTGIVASSTSWNRSGTDVFLANTADNVGVGTANPVGKLNVVGDGNFTGNVTATYFIGDGSQLTGIAAGSGSGAWTNTSGVIYPENLSHEVAIGTNNSQGFRLNVNGDVNVADGSGYYYGGVEAFKLANGTLGEYVNTQIGYNAGNETSRNQTVVGFRAGNQNIGTYQVAVGYDSGRFNTGNRITSIGSYAGYSNTGNHQTATGYESGMDNTGGSQAVFGYQAGKSNSGSFQTALGYRAGLQNTADNQTAVGYFSGYNNQGDHQTAIGFNAGSSNTGKIQTALGLSAGSSNTGDRQVAIGFLSGFQNQGNYTISIGDHAGYSNDGNNLIAIGYQAGYQALGENNVFIGYESGKNSGQSNLFIVKQASVNSVPLIRGNFSSGNVAIGANTPTQKLHVEGNLNVTGTIYGDGSGITGLTASSTSWNRTNPNVYLSNTSDSVGIGTSNPQQKLHVNGSILSNGTVYASNISSLSPLQLQTGGTTRIYVDDSTGNVGLGTSSPDSQLQVSDTGDTKIIVSSDADGAGVYTYSPGAPSQPWAGLVSTSNPAEGNYLLLDNGGSLRITETLVGDTPSTWPHNLGSTLAYFDTSLNRIGFGTESPKNFFNVVGDANFTGNTTTQTDFCIEGGECLSSVSTTATGWNNLANQVQLINASKNFNVSNLFVDNANGKTGIGTSNPVNELNVIGDINATGNITGAYFIGDGSQLTGINSGSGTGTVNGSGSNGYVAVWNSTSSIENSAIYQDVANEIGIGTTSPNASLEVYASSGNEFSVFDGFYQYNIGGDVADYTGVNTNAFSIYKQSSKTHFDTIGGVGGFYFDVESDTKAVILESGNVGIGTESPSDILDVNGSINIFGGQSYRYDGLDAFRLSNAGSGAYAGILVGHLAGNLTAQNQTVFGYQAGFNNTAINQLALGYRAGMSNTGYLQSAFGYQAGFNNSGIFQLASGYRAGMINSGDNQSAFGYEAGFNNSGAFQLALGYRAGYNNTGNNQISLGERSGERNSGNGQIAIGDLSGYANTGDYQVAIGDFSGGTSGDYQVFVGYQAGQSSTKDYQAGLGYRAGYSSDGINQVAVGRQAGMFNLGTNQIALGYEAGYENTGNQQVALGRFAGYENIGSKQVALGFYAGYQNEGNQTVALGENAGYDNWGNNSIFLGYEAGRHNRDHNQFIVKQANVNDFPLIQGDFETGNVGIGVENPNRKLHVNGTARITEEVTLNNLSGTYSGGSAYVCVRDDGTIYADDSGC